MNAYNVTGSDLRALGYELAPDGDYLMTEATIARIEYLVGWGLLFYEAVLIDKPHLNPDGEK